MDRSVGSPWWGSLDRGSVFSGYPMNTAVWMSPIDQLEIFTSEDNLIP